LARDRLHVQLARSIDCPVTTVSGPPGSGKTVLLSGWAQHEAPPVAWLSVDGPDDDRADNDRADNELTLDEPALFWRRLTQAVHAVDAGLAATIRAAGLQAAGLNAAGLNATGLNATGLHATGTGARGGLGDHELPTRVSPPAMAPVVLVVDDAHVLGPEAIRTLGSLIKVLPPRLRLILAGRHLSRLPLGEWRGRNQWGEIEGHDLRFTADEAVALFASPTTSPVPAETARALADRTEGWAAGLRLADLMFPLFSDPAGLLEGFTGEARLLVEYFNRELIERRPARQVRFLLASSALDLLTPEGCAAVTGRSDAGVLLETLCRQQALLERRDPPNPDPPNPDAPAPSYRYHRLFHEFLRHKLRTEAPAIARLSHLRAAAWCEAHGDDRASVHHLIEAGSHPEAFARGLPGVVRTLDGRYLPGGAGLAVTDLPEGFEDGDPTRTYVLAAAQLAGLRVDAAAGRLRALERYSREHADCRTGAQARSELLRSFRAGLLCDASSVVLHFERAVDLARSAHEPGAIPEVAPVSDLGPTNDDLAHHHPAAHDPAAHDPAAHDPAVHDLDSVLWRHLRALTAAAHVWLGEPDSARSVLNDGADGKGPLDDVDRLSVEARLAGHEGRLQEARLLAEAALAAGRRTGRTGSLSTLDALRTLAAVLYEHDDLNNSAARLGEARPLCAAADLAHWRAALACEEARILVARGDARSALDLLTHLRNTGYNDPLPAPLYERLDRVETRCRLALGDLDGAARLVQSLPGTARAVETVARLDLAAGRPDRAAERLVAAGPTPRLRIDIERLLLLSRACLQLGDERRCDIALHRAIDQGRPDRFIRVFVDEGAELAGLLTRISARSDDLYISELVARTAGGPPLSRPAPVRVLEPFTERERELLSYLPSHLSQHEIAGVMYISLNTVKTHTKAVYRKLGATCRSDAVDAARAHGLL
jgi:LuxR family maltose regulon positive regulatory protein